MLFSFWQRFYNAAITPVRGAGSRRANVARVNPEAEQGGLANLVYFRLNGVLTWNLGRSNLCRLG